MAKKIKIRARWDPLTKRSTEALNAGMSYGKYMAKIYESESGQREERERLLRKHKDKKRTSCKYCGCLIPDGGKYGDFCSYECRKQWGDNQKAAEERGVFKDNGRTCKHCGKPLIDKQRLYCNDYCRAMHNQEAAKNRYEEKRKEKRKNLTCKVCGFPITEPGRRIYCSDACMRVNDLNKKKEKRDGKKQLAADEIEV